MKQTTYEKWETERTHRIGLSVHEMQILLDAMRDAHTFPYTWSGDHQRIDERIERLRYKVLSRRGDDV